MRTASPVICQGLIYKLLNGNKRDKIIMKSANKSAEQKNAFCRSLFAQSTQIAKALFWFFASAVLCGCLEVKQSIVLDSEGSGSVVVKIVVDKQWAPLVVPDLKKAFQKDMQKAVLKLTDETKDEAGNSVLLVSGVFRNVAELSDKDTQYVFVTEGGGLFTKTYRFEIRQLETMKFDVPIPFEFLVKMPGTVDETNGIKVSSHEVKWSSQTGFRKGTVLSAKSTATPLLGMLLYGAGAIILLAAGWFFLSRRVPKAVAPIQSAAPMIFCTECGQKNSESATFCTHCGQKVVVD